MKLHYVFLLAVFIVASASRSLGEGAVRTFTTPDGRSLNAVIREYNDRNGKIQIEREDGKKVWILPTVFSAEDQAYIQQWIKADQFMSPIKFKINGDSNKGDKVSDSETKGSDVVILGETVDIKYELIFDNRTSFPLKDLKVEYRAFILDKGYEDLGDSNHVDGGQLTIIEIPIGKKVSKAVKPITLVSRYKTVSEYGGSDYGNSYYGKKTNQETLKGFWIKVYGPELDGQRVVREWCYPEDTREEYAWQDKTR